MGVIDRLLGREPRQRRQDEPRRTQHTELAGQFLPLPDDGFVKVVGESHCQDALRAVAGECVPGVEGRPSFLALLAAEPDNPFDPNAIEVHAPTRIGYLARDTAERYADTFAALHGAGYDGASCAALLNGGTTDKASYGVVLVLAYPEDCELHLGL